MPKFSFRSLLGVFTLLAVAVGWCVHLYHTNSRLEHQRITFARLHQRTLQVVEEMATFIDRKYPAEFKTGGWGAATRIPIPVH